MPLEPRLDPRAPWKELLGGGRGRLTAVPASIRISAVGRWSLLGYPGYELRAVRVWAASHGLLAFDGEWPAKPPPPAEPEYAWEPRVIPTSALAVSDLPGADADEDAYHRFALSFNGYQELGSTRRCGADRQRKPRTLAPLR